MKLRNFSNNLSTVNFSKLFKLSKFASFQEEQTWCDNQIFNKKQKSYASFFLLLCLTPFVTDITFITLLLSHIYVCTSFCLMYRLENDGISKSVPIFSKFML